MGFIARPSTAPPDDSIPFDQADPSFCDYHGERFGGCSAQPGTGVVDRLFCSVDDDMGIDTFPGKSSTGVRAGTTSCSTVTTRCWFLRRRSEDRSGAPVAGVIVESDENRAPWKLTVDGVGGLKRILRT